MDNEPAKYKRHQCGVTIAGAATGITARWMGRSTVGEMIKPGVVLRVHNTGAEGNSEAYGWRWASIVSNRYDFGNTQMPQSLKRPKKELDQPHFRSEPKAGSWGRCGM